VKPVILKRYRTVLYRTVPFRYRDRYLFVLNARIMHIPYSYRLETIKVINKECEREIKIVKDELQAFYLGQYHKTEKNRVENAQKDFFDKTLTSRRKKKHVEKKKDKDKKR
jgi:hypothetical protein